MISRSPVNDVARRSGRPVRRRRAKDERRATSATRPRLRRRAIASAIVTQARSTAIGRSSTTAQSFAGHRHGGRRAGRQRHVEVAVVVAQHQRRAAGRAADGHDEVAVGADRHADAHLHPRQHALDGDQRRADVHRAPGVVGARVDAATGDAEAREGAPVVGAIGLLGHEGLVRHRRAPAGGFAVGTTMAPPPRRPVNGTPRRRYQACFCPAFTRHACRAATRSRKIRTIDHA